MQARSMAQKPAARQHGHAASETRVPIVAARLLLHRTLSSEPDLQCYSACQNYARKKYAHHRLEALLQCAAEWYEAEPRPDSELQRQEQSMRRLEIHTYAPRRTGSLTAIAGQNLRQLLAELTSC